MLIAILNPVIGGVNRVGAGRAARLVKSGRAEWDGKPGQSPIRFKQSHHRHIAAQKQAALPREGYDRMNRLLTYEELAALPVVKPRELVAPRGKRVIRPQIISVAATNYVPERLRSGLRAVGRP